MSADFDFHAVYEHSRVSLWIEDYSGIRQQLDALRALGVTDLTAWLDAHPEMIETCVASIKVLEVNDYTLKMFRAPSRRALLENLHLVFRGDMRVRFRHELESLWEGRVEMDMETVNYALDGTPLYLQLARSILPGHEGDWTRILISLTDTSERKHALDRAAANERYAQSLFEHSPVSLWVEDLSSVKAWLGELRAAGVSNFARYLADNHAAVAAAMKLIRVLEVNRQTLTLYQARSTAELAHKLDRIFRDDMQPLWEAELLDMWNGRLECEYEGVNYALDGSAINVVVRTAPLPGAEHTWDRVLVAVSDITARKKAEAKASYLSTHDLLTGLHNRGYFEERLLQMEKEERYPASVVMIDLNGLKLANDAGGHEAGDALIRRAGEVIAKVAEKNDLAARLGGDEFALLLPCQDERAALAKVAQLETLLDANNRFFGGTSLSLSIGVATGHAGEPLEQVQRQADKHMYEAKRAHYRRLGLGDRRAG
jgi:diguanylate cyclase (GGDEF)-like protein